jgi:hypothetical protein
VKRELSCAGSVLNNEMYSPHVRRPHKVTVAVGSTKENTAKKKINEIVKQYVQAAAPITL